MHFAKQLVRPDGAVVDAHMVDLRGSAPSLASWPLEAVSIACNAFINPNTRVLGDKLLAFVVVDCVEMATERVWLKAIHTRNVIRFSAVRISKERNPLVSPDIGATLVIGSVGIEAPIMISLPVLRLWEY